MGKIGSIHLKTDDGIVEVPVFEPGDLSSEFNSSLRIHTDSGTGVIPMVDPSEASFPFLRMMTENGVVAFHNEAGLGALIDDFEDGDIEEYEFDGGGSSSYFSVNSNSSFVYEGDYSLRMEPAGTGGNGIVSTSGLNSYPEDGDTLEWFIWFEELNGGTYAARPEIRIGSGGDGDPIRFRYSNKTNELRFIYAGVNEPFNPSDHMYEWLRTVMEIKLPEVSATVYDSNGNEIQSITASYSDWDISNSSIGYYITSSTAGDSTIFWDSIQKI